MRTEAGLAMVATVGLGGGERSRPIATIVSRVALVVGVVLSGCAGLPCDTGPAREVAAVKRSVEAFRTSLVARDRATYMNLFFSDRPDEVGWQAVVDDARLRAIRRERPQAIKARRIPGNNFVALFDSIVASADGEEERMENVCVHTDGEIASAVFDYTYLAAGRPTNRGAEHWQLVRTDEAWKIFSVVYTIRDP